MSDHALKGILLAGGSGTRLYPLTHVVSKQLMAVYDKPLIYYPLSTLMLAGLRDILVISTPEALPSFQRLLGDGEWLGLNLSYAAQPRPEGIAQAFVIGREFIGSSRSCLVLGDNIFYGHGLPAALAAARERREGATVFGYRVRNPSRYGVIAFEGDHRPVAIDEKPAHPRSRYAVTGLYFYDNRVLDYAAELRPSARGELEITDINRRYLAAGELNVEILGRGMVWLDTGTHESLLQAANFIEAIEQRQGLKIGCVEEIAWRLGLITAEQLAQLGHSLAASAYGQYLLDILDEAGPPR